VIAVFKVSPQAKEVSHLKCADTRCEIAVFARSAHAPKFEFFSAFRAKPLSGSRRKQRKNMQSPNGGHLSERNAEAKNDRNIKSREDRTAFGHTQ